jgi:ADP-heptose:LPS heptosyltransferase
MDEARYSRAPGCNMASRTGLARAQFPVVFFSNGIGDGILALPALRALSALFDGRLTLIADKRLLDTFFGELEIEAKVEVVDMRRESLPSRRRVFDVSATLERVPACDLFISLVAWHAPSIDELVRVLAPTVTIGYFPVFDLVVAPNIRKHSADLAFDVVQLLDPAMRLMDYSHLPARDREATALAQGARRRVNGRRIMSVHADTSEEKCWPSSRFNNFISAFLEHHDDFVVWIVGMVEVGLAYGTGADRVHTFVGAPLGFSFALLRESDVFVGVDSCFLHAADLFRIPGVGLFGATRAMEWGFRLGPHRHVEGRGGLHTVRAEDVLERVEELFRDPGGVVQGALEGCPDY